MPENKGCMPFIIAVTGHRDMGEFVDNTNIPIEDAIEECLRYWAQKIGPTTPIWLVSGMAQGADIVAVRVAEKIKPQGINIIIKPCLFAPLESISSAYDTPDDYTYVQSICNENGYFIVRSEHDKAGDNIDISDSFQYLYQGAFLARYANVVLALWDGEAAKGVGGTGDVVAMQLGNIPDIPEIKELFLKGFDGSNGGVVQHIKATRTQHPRSTEVSQIGLPVSIFSDTSFPVYITSTLQDDMHTFLLKEFLSLIKQLSLFNSKSTFKTDEGTSAGLCPQSAAIFTLSDQLAVSERNRYHYSMSAFFVFALSSLVALEFIEYGFKLPSGFLITAISFFCVIVCMGIFSSSKIFGWKRNYHLYRGVAEAFRLRGYLNLAGIKPCQSSILPRQMRTSLPLFQQALHVAEWSWWSDKTVIEPERVKEEWLDNQIEFLYKRLNAKPTSVFIFRPKELLGKPGYFRKKIEKLSPLLFWSALALLMVLLIVQYLGIASFYIQIFLGVKMFLLLSAILALWYNLAAYEHVCIGYERLIEFYKRADAQLDQGLDYEYTLQELAKEAFNEHCEWILNNSRTEYNSGH